VSACGGLVGGDRATATIQTLRSGNGLQQREDGLHAAFEVVVLGLDLLALAESVLQFLEGLLALELLDATLERLDLVAGALADGALGLAVVCSLLGQLLGRQVGDTARRGAVGLAFSAIGSGGVCS
jgi:hypothetical protein